GTIELSSVDDETRLVRDRRLEHPEPELRGRLGRRTMRRPRREHEPHLGERRALEQLESDPQVTDVDGVERAAEHTDRPNAARNGARGRHAARELRALAGASIASTHSVIASQGGAPG